MTDGILALADAAPRATVYLEDARSSRAITYGELADALHAGVTWFAARPDLKRVALDIDDPLSLAVAHLTVIAAGRLSAPLDPDAPSADRERAVRALACDVIVSDRTDPTPAVLDVVHHDELRAEPGEHPTVSAGGGVLMRTSGSTGTPKVVLLRENQLLAVAQAVATNLALRTDDRGYNPLPLFHINGQVVAVLATLAAESTLVLDRRFHRTDFWPLMNEREVTWINAVPAILGVLAHQTPAPPPTLRLIRSASAPLPDALRRHVQDALHVPVVESYGMTEAGSQITAGAVDGSTPPGSVGAPAGAQVEVRGADANGIGRIWIRGAGVIGSYEGGRAADRFDDGGWLDSGDDGRFGEHGELYIAGRSDDQINRGGELIYPTEVEEVLRGDDRVADVAVVGRPHDTLGAVPVAVVVAAATETAGLVDDLTRRAASDLSRYKRPVEILLVDDLPRAATGKVKRAAVRAELGDVAPRAAR
ncbi:class I adenylate-forming enzyme family protein [uncultured Jatrophihabitans sp.]|uniref:class I adenylate-forming enzyme family protein n=1 Tax=uncultured Jatrophihabitans sp. TaxID=1610747 RepID=UPI0035CA4CBE